MSKYNNKIFINDSVMLNPNYNETWLIKHNIIYHVLNVIEHGTYLTFKEKECIGYRFEMSRFIKLEED